jgi:hypothetical protein
MISLLVFWGMLGISPQNVLGSEDPSFRLVVEDILSKPGKSVQLTAQLLQENQVDLIGVEGEEIAFFVSGQPAGSAVTGGNGKALLEFSTSMRGNHSIKAIHLANKNISNLEGYGNLAAWERRRPVLLIDVRTLLEPQDQKIQLELNVKEWPEPRERAVLELQNIGEFYYNVVYVLWNQDDFPRDRLRDWLWIHEFPHGLTRVLQPGASGLEGFIEDLKEKGWDNLEAGIGATPEFAEVLVRNRILAIILPKAEGAKFPRRAKVISHWKYVRKHL